LISKETERKPHVPSPKACLPITSIGLAPSSVALLLFLFSEHHKAISEKIFWLREILRREAHFIFNIDSGKKTFYKRGIFFYKSIYSRRCY
jgi:hypothetical protein